MALVKPIFKDFTSVVVAQIQLRLLFNHLLDNVTSKGQFAELQTISIIDNANVILFKYFRIETLDIYDMLK